MTAEQLKELQVTRNRWAEELEENLGEYGQMMFLTSHKINTEKRKHLPDSTEILENLAP